MKKLLIGACSAFVFTAACTRLNLDQSSRQPLQESPPSSALTGQPLIAGDLYRDGQCLLPSYAEISPSVRVFEAAKSPARFVGDLRTAINTRISHYTATVTRERFKNEKLQPPETIFSACRLQPLALYLRWDTGDFQGREALFVKGQNHNRILIKLTGLMSTFVKTVELAPNDPVVTDHGRLPPVDQQQVVAPFDEILKAVREHPTIQGRPALSITPSPTDAAVPIITIRWHEPHGKLHRILFTITLNPDTLLPSAIVTFDTQGRVVEVLRFTDWHINDPLPSETFDRNNPAYQFSGIIFHPQPPAKT